MGSRAILLMNTGSPDSTSVPDVRRYLNEFLMDPHVIDLPLPLRALLVKGIILPRRPKHSAEAYKQIWTDKGSPLLTHTHALADAFRQRVDEPVAVAMRYGSPSYMKIVDDIVAGGADEIVLLPLFPHYAMATVGTCVDAVREHLNRRQSAGCNCTLTVCPPFYDHPAFISALQKSLQPAIDDPDLHLLLSFHGLPERHILKADPTGHHCMQSANCCTTDSPAHATCYRAQCLKTVAALDIPADRLSVAFQSRLGRAKWLSPYTSDLIRALPKQGVTKLAVACPSFVCDCLETLEEIAIRAKDEFLAAGGESLTLIPCLNESSSLVDVLVDLVQADRSDNG